MKEESNKKKLNNYVAVRIKAVSSSMKLSAVFAGFFNTNTEKMDISHSSVVMREDLFNKLNLKQKSVNFVRDIINIAHNYEVHPQISHLSAEAIQSRCDEKGAKYIIQRYNDKDYGAIEFIFKKIFDEVFSVDDTKVQGDFDIVYHGTIELVYAFEKLDKITVAEKEAIANKYTDNNKTLTNKIIEEIPEDITIAKVIINGTDLTAAGLIYVSNLTNKFIAANFISGKNDEVAAIINSRDIVGFCEEINALLETKKEQAVIEANIIGSDMGLVINAVVDSFADKLKTIISKNISPIIPNPSIEIEFQKFNSLIVNFIITPPEKIKPQIAVEVETGQKIHTIEVNLILSPTKGKKISELRKGDRIQVMLDPSLPSSQKLIRNMNLKDGDRIKPLNTVVHSVKKGTDGNYIVLSKIGGTLYGKSIEEEDIKIRCEEQYVPYEEEESGSSKSLIIGLIVGIIVIAIIAIVIMKI